jgi:lipooligosaccharide transport system permease protein
MTITDVVIGEWVWAAIKGTLSGIAILLVMTALGLVKSVAALWVLPVIVLVGLTFAGLALIVTSLAKAYDLFTYYFSLFVMPMMLVSGVFFPAEQLPKAVQYVAQVLPLVHATALTRGLVVGAPLDNIPIHVGVLVIYAGGTVCIATRLVQKRLSK